MKQVLLRMLLAVFAVAVFSVLSFAADPAPPAKAQGQDFEKHRANVLSRIDARIARNQEEKTCVQAAKNPGELKACQEKFKAEVKQQREQMKK
jgi:hypothetical protein